LVRRFFWPLIGGLVGLCLVCGIIGNLLGHNTPADAMGDVTAARRSQAPETPSGTSAAPSIAPTPEPTAEPTSAPTVAPTPVPSPTVDPVAYPLQPPDTVAAQVVGVVDGDTLDVALDGGTERIRLIGVDTPETKDPRKPVQCFGVEAAAEAQRLLEGQTVQLEEDLSQGSRDRYGRLLRYVWLPDGKLFNLELISGGYAHEYTFDEPYTYQAVFKQAAADARERGWGLWAATSCNGNTEQAAEAPTLQPAPAVRAAEPPAPAQGTCDPSYPGVCIPPYPPDLDCGDVGYKRFDVVPPDPHGFDRDGDGIGCER